MLKDGKDFACGGVHNVQDKNKILTGVKMYIDRGDFHLFLDANSDGCYKLKSLILRYELADKDATINDLGDNRYELISGSWKAVVTTLPAMFNGHNIIWRIGKTDEIVYLDAVLYEGEVINLCLDKSVLTEIVIATELIKKDALPVGEKPSSRHKDNLIEAKWQNMTLVYNPYGEKY
jgi:hypothetical protein